MKKLIFIFFVLILSSSLLFSQVAVNTGGNPPDSSAMLDVQSTTKGFLPPRMTSAEMGAIINPATGLMVFNLDLNKPAFFNGTFWVSINGQQQIYNLPCSGTPTVLYGGQTYNTVVIGSQCWLKENLNVGMLIDSLQEMYNNGTVEKYCYHNEEDSCTKYGGLYQWDEMMQYTTTPGVQGICPQDWHVPTDSEWTTLTDYVSSVSDFLCNSDTTYIAKALADNTDWHSSIFTCAPGNNLDENNATGFSAMPGGNRYSTGAFFNVVLRGFWWTSTEHDFIYAWSRFLSYYETGVYRDYGHRKVYGFSVRCLRDN